MGRQLAIDLTEEEEQEFLSFLCKSANVQIIRTFARTPDALFIDSLDPRGPGNWSFYLWNTDFPWQPVLAQTRDDLPEPDRRGLYYFSNIDTAPALTYSRPVPDAGIAYGRIYWAKRFSTANGLNYDVEAFSEWYDRTARWLRALKAKAARTHAWQERTRKG